MHSWERRLHRRCERTVVPRLAVSPRSADPTARLPSQTLSLSPWLWQCCSLLVERFAGRSSLVGRGIYFYSFRCLVQFFFSVTCADCIVCGPILGETLLWSQLVVAALQEQAEPEHPRFSGLLFGIPLLEAEFVRRCFSFVGRRKQELASIDPSSSSSEVDVGK